VDGSPKHWILGPMPSGRRLGRTPKPRTGTCPTGCGRQFESPSGSCGHSRLLYCSFVLCPAYLVPGDGSACATSRLAQRWLVAADPVRASAEHYCSQDRLQVWARSGSDDAL
jgi:hypothetical protein